MSRTLTRGALVALLLVATTATTLAVRSEPADAFGTVNLPGTSQRVVHEKITRVLSCTSTQKPASCFDPISMSLLAGQPGTFGAVGEPDNPLDGNPNPAARHCDDGDYGYGSSHGQAEAWSELKNCLTYYQAYMKFAVDSAAGLLKPDGSIDPAATDQINFFGSNYNACRFPDPQKGHTSNDSAKCNVINGLGRALHLYEDFWSHSNWGDIASPDRAEDLTNPKGLAQTNQPDFFAYPTAVPSSFPEDLISGCDDSLSSSRCTGRTGHSVLNKDNGETVNPDNCTVNSPLTERAKVTTGGTSNFQRAVTGACGAALRAWSDLQAALVSTYGQAKATNMIRAITKDTPLTSCIVGGGAAKAKAPPVGVVSSARSVTISLVNSTDAALSCSTANLEGGEWANYPPDGVAPGATAGWRTQSNGVMTGTEGSASFAIAGSNSMVTVRWNNPYIGSNGYSCDAGPGFACTTNGSKGNDSTVTFTLTRK
jgi:hypothetical protein